MKTLFSKEMFRYILRSGIIVTGTQLLFIALLLLLNNFYANLLALISMLYPGLWLDKRFVFQNKEPFNYKEVEEFLTASIAPIIVSPLAVHIAGDQENYILSAISIGVFGIFWFLKFLLQNRRWA